MKIVWVKWLDAMFMGNVWKQADKLKSDGCHMETAGFLVNEDKTGIYIAVDVDPDDNKRVRGVTFIPRAMVRKKRYFTVKK